VSTESITDAHANYCPMDEPCGSVPNDKILRSAAWVELRIPDRGSSIAWGSTIDAALEQAP